MLRQETEKSTSEGTREGSNPLTISRRKLLGALNPAGLGLAAVGVPMGLFVGGTMQDDQELLRSAGGVNGVALAIEEDGKTIANTAAKFAAASPAERERQVAQLEELVEQLKEKVGTLNRNK